MFFTPVIRRNAYAPALRSLNAGFDQSFDRFLEGALFGQPSKALNVEQDDQSYTLRLDVPGLAKEQLAIALEGSVVRINSLADAPRKFNAAYELPQDIDTANSQAKLENGVLTLKLGKKVAASTATPLPIH
jgi:HSP20 family molecular chaperone IbpA